MPKFHPYNSSNTQTGMYFCSDEEVSEQNVKIGTFQSAEEKCNRILTPKICDNQTVAYKIQNLTLKAQEGFDKFWEDFVIDGKPLSVDFLTKPDSQSNLLRSQQSTVYVSGIQIESQVDLRLRA